MCLSIRPYNRNVPLARRFHSSCYQLLDTVVNTVDYIQGPVSLSDMWHYYISSAWPLVCVTASWCKQIGAKDTGYPRKSVTYRCQMQGWDSVPPGTKITLMTWRAAQPHFCTSCVEHLFTSGLGYILWLCLGESCEIKDITWNSIPWLPCKCYTFGQAAPPWLDSTFTPNYDHMSICVVVCETTYLHQSKPLLHVVHILHPISDHTPHISYMASVYNLTLNGGNVSHRRTNTVHIIQTRDRLWALSYYKNVCLQHKRRDAI